MLCLQVLFFFSPLQVCIIGDGVFKFFRLQEGTFKGIPNQLNKMREAGWVHHTDFKLTSNTWPMKRACRNLQKVYKFFFLKPLDVKSR